MTPIEVLQMIRADCEADAKRWEGQLMNGHAVAQIHGELLAMIMALSSVIEEHLTEELEQE